MLADTEPDRRRWWHDSVVYQIYPRSFADSDGDGIGDLRGIIGRLDYLHQLGVDVLWLSPIYPSPQDDNGYDISDYQGIEPVFGTLADFDELLAGVHARGMKLVMDLVVNHTSDEHPWFVESRTSRDNPKRDWYWWRAPRSGHEAGAPGAEPTNWGSFFSGPTWTLDTATGEYYLHLFSPKQPDLNWENPAVRAAVYEMMRWWVDRGIDGFRMDVINMVSKDTALPDGPVHPGARFGDGWPSFICGPRIHEFMAELHAAVLAPSPRPLVTVGEMPGVTVDDARRFSDPARAELDMVFQFEHVGVDQGITKWDRIPLDLPRLKAVFARWQTGLADAGWNSLYWDNHDQPRHVSRFGDDGVHRVRSAKALATVLHLQRGTPYVYQGDELGMTNAPFPTVGDLRDLESTRHYAEAVELGADPDAVLASIRVATRDNARTPMQWDGSANAGFSTGEPWIGVNPNYPAINAAAAVADPNSVFHHYRRLIELRKAEPTVVHGEFALLLPDDPAVFAFTRRCGDVTLLIAANLSGASVTAAIDDAAGWAASELLVTNADSPPASEGGALVLAPWEAVVLRRSDGAG